jgi:carbamoyl-phosphate synthase large subunit
MDKSADKTSVLVTGVGGGAVGHQVLHALQLLGNKYDITAVDADSYSFGLYEVQKRYVVPLASAPGYLKAIQSVIAREKIKVVIPGTEAELKVLAAHREAITCDGCLVLVNPLPVVDLCLNKFHLSQWLREHGFGTPDTVRADDWRSLAARKGFPLVAKPCSNSSGSRNVSILSGEQEVLRYLDSCDAAGIIFQEYIDAADEEYTVGLCVDYGSRLIDSIALRRKLTGMTLGSRRVISDRSYALSTGYSQGFIVKQPTVQAACERLVESIGICGPANIQCRLVHEQVMIFEVHPRFSGTTSLRADVGFNEPDILIRALLHGERLGRQAYKTDVAVIRAFQSLVVPVAEMEAIPRIH